MERTPHSIANEVRMGRTQYDGTYLLTEGDTDARVFARFTDDTGCRTIDCRGKENAVEAIKILDKSGTTGVLAIVDADFDRIREKQIDSPNIVLTDLHDFDLMMITTPAFGKVLAEYGSQNKISQFEKRHGKRLLDHLMKEACKVGALRLLSQDESLNLKFKGCRYAQFVDDARIEVRLDKLVKAIKNNSQMHTLDDDDLICKCNAILGEPHSLFELACGHDVSQLLSIGLRSTLGSNNASAVDLDRIEASLRLAYESTFFDCTKLKVKVSEWEDRNPGRVVWMGSNQ